MTNLSHAAHTEAAMNVLVMNEAHLFRTPLRLFNKQSKGISMILAHTLNA